MIRFFPVPASLCAAATAATATAAAIAFVTPFAALAQGPAPAASAASWQNQTEFSLLTTGGNSSTSTLGLRNTLRRAMETGDLRIDLSVLRTDASRIERRAVGTAESFRVETDTDTERTAERYAAQARYDRNLSERTFAYGSTGWVRNTPAGFNYRSVTALGAGTRIERPDAWETKVGAALTYTFQEDVDPDPTRDNSFAGLRGTLDHLHQLTTGTRLEVKWVVDANAQEWGDARGDLSQSVSASLTDRLALKTTLQFLVDNEPPSRRIPLVDAGGEPTGSTVLTPLGKVDRSLSIALVVTL